MLHTGKLPYLPHERVTFAPDRQVEVWSVLQSRIPGLGTWIRVRGQFGQSPAPDRFSDCGDLDIERWIAQKRDVLTDERC